MNIRQLEIFWAIMRSGSATGAAQLLAISQPAVSKILRHTEDQLQMKLFVRRSGRLYPTAEARQLFIHAEAIFDGVSKLRQAANDFRDSLSGRIQIVSSPTLASTLLPVPIAEFLKNRPRVDLSLKVLTTNEVVTRVSLQQADLGLAYGPVIEPSVLAEDIWPMELACFLPRTHRLAQSEKIELTELSAERIISFHRTTLTGAAIRRAFDLTGRESSVSIECDHSLVAMSLVASGAGVALVPPVHTLLENFPDVVMRPLAVHVPVRPQLFYPRMPIASRLTTTLVEHLRNYARTRQPAQLDAS